MASLAVGSLQQLGPVPNQKRDSLRFIHLRAFWVSRVDAISSGLALLLPQMHRDMAQTQAMSRAIYSSRLQSLICQEPIPQSKLPLPPRDSTSIKVPDFLAQLGTTLQSCSVWNTWRSWVAGAATQYCEELPGQYCGEEPRRTAEEQRVLDTQF